MPSLPPPCSSEQEETGWALLRLWLCIPLAAYTSARHFSSSISLHRGCSCVTPKTWLYYGAFVTVCILKKWILKSAISINTLERKWPVTSSNTASRSWFICLIIKFCITMPIVLDCLKWRPLFKQRPPFIVCFDLSHWCGGLMRACECS